MRFYNMEINFFPKGHRKQKSNFPLHRQSEKASMCFYTRWASTRNFMIPINHSLNASKKQWQMHLNVLQNSEKKKYTRKLMSFFFLFSLPFFTEFLPIPVQPPTEVLQRQTGLSPNAQALFQFILFNIFCQMDVPNNRGYLESKSFFSNKY